MGKIIQRDFFPDLEKLKVQSEYLDAMEKNDVIRMRELHLKYTGKRPPTQRSKLFVFQIVGRFLLKHFDFNKQVSQLRQILIAILTVTSSFAEIIIKH